MHCLILRLSKAEFNDQVRNEISSKSITGKLPQLKLFHVFNDCQYINYYSTTENAYL